MGGIAGGLLSNHNRSCCRVSWFNGLAGDSYFLQFYFHSPHHYHFSDHTSDREISGFKPEQIWTRSETTCKANGRFYGSALFLYLHYHDCCFLLPFSQRHSPRN